jgi:pimeloyl-ACP methyl ester carboxylesterase
MPTVENGSVQIHFRDGGGAALPLLLLHAFPLNSGMWEPQFEALGDVARPVAPDLRGFGSSTAPPDPSDYSMGSFASDAIAVLDAAGIESCVVAGLSMGGYVAFELLRRAPERVGALVLADTRAESDAPEALEKRTAQQRKISDGGLSDLKGGLIEGLLGPVTKRERPEVVDAVRELMDGPPQGYVGALEAMKQRPDSSNELARFERPILIIVGADDTLTPPVTAIKMQALAPHARVEVIADAGHLSNMEAPEAFDRALRGFLADL